MQVLFVCITISFSFYHTFLNLVHSSSLLIMHCNLLCSFHRRCTIFRLVTVTLIKTDQVKPAYIYIVWLMLDLIVHHMLTTWVRYSETSGRYPWTQVSHILTSKYGAIKKTMSQVRGQLSAGGIVENGARSRRTIKLTRKALHNAIDNKRKEFRSSRKRLLSVMQLVDGLGDDSDIATLARDPTAASEEFGELLQDLFELYKQDVYGDFVEGAQLKEESDTLKQALSVI